MAVTPSYANGFARHPGESAMPGLWPGLDMLVSPALGPTGLTLHDWSRRRNDGTLTNMDPATDWVQGPDGWALDFNGTNGVVSIPSAFANVSGIRHTLHIRCKWDLTDNSGCVFWGTTTGSTVYWQINEPSNNFIVAVRSMTGAGSGYDDGLWHSMTFVSRGADGVAGYRDGIEVISTASDATALVAGPKNFYLGDWIGGAGGNFTFNGQMDFAAFWGSRALTSGEIADLHADPLGMLRKRRFVAKAPAPAAGIVVLRRRRECA